MHRLAALLLATAATALAGPSHLDYTYYYANAACSGPNATGSLKNGTCTFIEFDDGQGALNYADFVAGEDAPCQLYTWTAETCQGQPSSIIRAQDAVGCRPTLGGISAMLVC